MTLEQKQLRIKTKFAKPQSARVEADAIAKLIDNDAPMHELELLFSALVIRHRLQKTHGNKCAAARELALHRNTLDRRLAIIRDQAHARII